MIGLTMSLAQFECVKKFAMHPDAMLKAHDFKLENLSEDGLSGSIHTIEIDAYFEYREVGNTLVITKEQKHGMYKFVSDKTIGTHLQEILGDLHCEESSSTPVPEANLQPTTPAETTNEVQIRTALSNFVKPVQMT